MHTALSDRAEETLKSTAAAATRGIDAARDDLAARLRHLRGELEELEDRAIHGTRRALRTTDHAIHAHPYEAIGIAVAAGLLAGWLIARR